MNRLDLEYVGNIKSGNWKLREIWLATFQEEKEKREKKEEDGKEGGEAGDVAHSFKFLKQAERKDNRLHYADSPKLRLVQDVRRGREEADGELGNDLLKGDEVSEATPNEIDPVKYNRHWFPLGT